MPRSPRNQHHDAAMLMVYAAAGLEPDQTRTVHKFGRNNDVDAQEDVWHGGGLYTGFADDAETLELFSSDINDTDLGTGLQEVRLFGLTMTGLEITEDVVLDGTTPVLTTQAFWRMNRAMGLRAGSGGFNAGTITARQSTTTTNVMMVMPAGRNQTHIAAYTVPAAYHAVITNVGWTLTRESGGAIDREAAVDLLTRESGGVFRSKRPLQLSSRSPADYPFRTGGIYCPALTDIVGRVFSVTTANSTVTCGFDIVLVPV